MTEQLSDKIKIASFLCTVMVVYRHSQNMVAFYGESKPGEICQFIEFGISKMTEIAVPYFFLVSGFFFFRMDYYSPPIYIRMLQKKFHTLFIPFVIWNLIGLCTLLATRQFTPPPTISQYISDLFMSQWNGPLWYVRDLMTMMIVAPMASWLFIYRENRKRTLLLNIFRQTTLFTTIIILFVYWIPVMSNWVATESILFFLLGGVLHKHESCINWKIPTKLLWTITIIWLISSCFYPFYWPIHKYNIILGLVIFWQILDYFPQNWNKRLLTLAPFSFFIYVNHIYIVKVIKISIAHIFFANEIAAITAYFILPLFVTTLLYHIGRYWKKIFPKSFAFVTGNRG